MHSIVKDVNFAIRSGSVQHYVIASDWGFGKSSLLHYLEKEFSQQKEVLPILLSGGQVLGNGQFFNKLIERFLEVYAKKKSLKENLKEKYTRALLATSSALAVATSTIPLPIDLTPLIKAAIKSAENKREWRKHAEQAIELVDKTSRDNGFHTILLLDDFDILLTSLGSDFAHDLRGRLSETTNLILISTATNASFFTKRDQPFYNFLKVYTLQSLTQEEIEESLTKIGEKAQVRYSDDSIKEIYSVSRGRPRYLAFLAREAALSAIGDNRSSVTKEDVVRGLDNVLASLEPAFRANYDSLPIVQRKILKAISEGQITPAQIYKSLHISRGSISPSIVRMLEKGILIRLGQARYEISDPLFQEWLKRVG